VITNSIGASRFVGYSWKGYIWVRFGVNSVFATLGDYLKVAGLLQNGWPESIGIGGLDHPEYADMEIGR